MSEMTGQAWVFMLGVWAFVAACTGYCFWKLLTSPRRFDPDADDPSSSPRTEAPTSKKQ